jgi:hypothetical protein
MASTHAQSLSGPYDENEDAMYAHVGADITAGSVMMMHGMLHTVARLRRFKPD